MSRILTVTAVFATDDASFLVEALRINDEFNNTNNADLAEDIFRVINQGAKQVEKYISLFPEREVRVQGLPSAV